MNGAESSNTNKKISMPLQLIPVKLTAIIVDDELHGRENLNKIIDDYCPEIEIRGLAESVMQAKELVNEIDPDVVFLDINMPVLDGFDFLDQFDERDFMAVFVSAHEEFGIKAVKAGAVDYLLKPVSIKELRQTVTKLVTLQNKNINDKLVIDAEKLIIPAANGFNVVVIDQIVRLQADGCYTKLIKNDGKYDIISRTLKDFENALTKTKFFRIHKSHIINLNYVKSYSSIDGSYVIMTDGSKIEISRRKAPDFVQKIKTVINTV